jgi:methionyl-tRNA formyltransferase
MLGIETEFRMMLHVADDTMDRGKEVIASPPVAIERDDGVLSLHHKATPVAGQLAVKHFQTVVQNQESRNCIVDRDVVRSDN